MFPDFDLGTEEQCPRGLTYSFGRFDTYRRLALRRRNSVWKWTKESRDQLKYCLSQGLCSDISHHLEDSTKFYAETSQTSESFKPDLTVCRQPEIFFVELEVHRSFPWENLRLMDAFSRRYPLLKIHFIQWLNKYDNPAFTFQRDYRLSRILGEAHGWPDNFLYHAIVLDRSYPKDNPTEEDIVTVSQRLLDALQKLTARRVE
jgi:hypothetical protein